MTGFNFYRSKRKIQKTSPDNKKNGFLRVKIFVKQVGLPCFGMGGYHKSEWGVTMERCIQPGDRNPVEGKFGQAKTTYDLNRVKASLSDTSLSWIATIIMVLNLVKLTGRVLYCLIRKKIKRIQITKKEKVIIVVVYLMFDKTKLKALIEIKFTQQIC